MLKRLGTRFHKSLKPSHLKKVSLYSSFRYQSLRNMRTKVVIMGAAGRDFHNFNTYFRNKENYEVIAFTAEQIPGIEGRTYPSQLAGESLYPNGIPIHEESELEKILTENKVDQVVFSYSDVSYTHVMRNSARAMACGADYFLLGPRSTQIKSSKPVISVVASRTGCGKSQTSRYIVEKLLESNLKVVSCRHPMPYGDLLKQKVQRFATYEDLIEQKCTIEEREEYEPYVSRGAIIYAGVDYQAILNEAEKEADVVLWDGGNNDMSFFKPDIEICVVDPHRVGDEISYFPGEVNVRTADIIIINKVDSANKEDISKLEETCKSLNSDATILKAESPLTFDNEEESIKLINNKRVLIVEDGPTLTHGGMQYGAGMVAAKQHNIKEIVDPRPFLKGKIQETFETYPNIGTLLPAMGYGDEQIKDLEDTINSSDADVVISGTPIDLSRIVKVNKPIVRVHYNLKCVDTDLITVIQDKFQHIF